MFFIPVSLALWSEFLAEIKLRGFKAMKVSFKAFNMKNNVVCMFRFSLIAVPLVCLALSLQAATEIGPNYIVFKEVKSNQSDVATVTLANNPYRFGVFVQATSDGSISGGTVSLPAGSSVASPQTLVAQNDGTGGYGFQQKFTDQASLNSSFNDGTYALQVTGFSSAIYNANLALTGGVYPSLTPTVTNTSWSGGNLLVDPSAPFTLTWGAFAGSTSTDHVFLSLQNAAFQTVFSLVLPNSATSQTFAASFFQPNQTYKANLSFFKVATTNTTDIPGATGFASYNTANGFSIQTVPEPQSMALLVGGGVSVVAVVRARHRRRRAIEAPLPT